MGAAVLLTMPDILFIKTSSLGDVIHHMRALTEARRQRLDARFCWWWRRCLHRSCKSILPSQSHLGRITPLAGDALRRRRGATSPASAAPCSRAATTIPGPLGDANIGFFVDLNEGHMPEDKFLVMRRKDRLVPIRFVECLSLRIYFQKSSGGRITQRVENPDGCNP
jgi:nucleotidyltransferase/DNA polymerase involved in DNA repair